MSNGKYHPASQEFKIVGQNKYGVKIELPDDSAAHWINPGQKWIPHAIEDADHPAQIGDIVSLGKYLSERLGISAAIVSGVRTFKDVKRSNGSRQIELLGLPTQWWGIHLFKEYHTHVRKDHTFGITFIPKPEAFY